MAQTKIKEQRQKLSDKEIANDKASRIMNGAAMWCSYYRANPHRFAKDYLNITLKLFQKILIFMMNFSTNFMYLAARGQGKSFILAIFCTIRCILYPDTKICVASKTRGQAIEILDKIKTILYPNSANLRLEIEDIQINQANAFISFRNGSRITVVTANDSARHNRANLLLIDEYRMVDLDIITKVLRKFLTAPRQPKYLNKPEYSHLAERNIEMYASSCWYESHWSYEKARSYCVNMIDNRRKYFVCGLPYQLSIKENLLSREQIEDEMSESDFSALGFQMEMECLWFSDADGGLYSYGDISKTRKIKYPFYPKWAISKINDKRIHIPLKANGEIRILSADIALMSSKNRNNDATSIFINQMMPTAGERFTHNIIYTDNYEGLQTDVQALIIRQLFAEYDCDYLVIDSKGVGLGVVDALLSDIYNSNTGETYFALSCCNNDEIAERCRVKNAPKKIWAIQGTAEFNSQCALGLREAFKQGQVRLLTSEFESDEALSELQGYSKLTPNEKIKLQLPYVHTSLLVNELINLEYEAKNNVIKVKEKSGMRKDRYSSLSYNIYVSKAIEREISTSRAKKSVVDMVMQFRAPQIKKNR